MKSRFTSLCSRGSVSDPPPPPITPPALQPHLPMTSTEIIAKLEIPAGYKKPSVDANMDGNAFSIIANVAKAVRKNDKALAERFSKFVHESESYDCLLQVCMSIADFEFEGNDGLFEDEDSYE